jgi:hypothetical protein
MEMVSGAGCPWWTGTLVSAPYAAAGFLVGDGPAGWIIGHSGLAVGAVVSYACSR